MHTRERPQRPTRRGDRGAGAVEYLGVVVVAVLLVGALVTAVARADVGTVIACQLRSVVDQSGTCGAPDVPTQYEGDGDTASAPASATPGSGNPAEPGTGPDYANAALDRPAPDEAAVADALDSVRDALDGGFWGVRGGDLDDATAAIEKLSGTEIDALVAQMSDEELEDWVDELDDGWLAGGWDREQRRELWEVFASKASKTTLDRLATFTDELQPSFEGVGGDKARDDPTSTANTATYGQVTHQLVVGTISPEDVSQGGIGDCWWIASMMAVAQANPAVIEQAIVSNANGTYTVRLYEDGAPVEVTVTPEMVLKPDGSPAFVSNDGKSDPYELWPMVLEKALALHYGDYNEIVGSTADIGLTALTGLPSTNTDPGVLSAAELSTLLEGGGAIGLSSLTEKDGADSPLYQPDRGNDMLHDGHAYYVSEVDVEAGTVTVVNPWGIAGNPPVTLTYEEFTEGFRQVRTNEVS